MARTINNRTTENSLSEKDASSREQNEPQPVQEVHEKLRALHKAGNELSKTHSFDELCRRAVELGRQRLGFDRLGLWFLDSENPNVIVGSFGIDEHGRVRDERGQRVNVRDTFIQDFFQKEERIGLFTDAALYDHRRQQVGVGCKAYAGIWNGERYIGYFSCDNLLSQVPITDQDCELLSLYASTVGHLCSLKRLEETLRTRNSELKQINDRLTGVFNSTKGLTNCSRIDQMGPLLLQEFALNLNAQGGSLYFKTNGNLSLIHALDFDHAPADLPFPLPSGSILERAITQGEPVLIEDIENEGNVQRSGWDGYQDASLLVFPLRDENGTTIGVLSLHNKQTPPFTSQDLELGRILASFSCEVLRVMKTNEELRRSEERFRNLAELLPEIVYEVDDKGILTFVNQQSFEITGYTQNDFDRGFEAVRLFVPEDRDRARENICKIVQGGQRGYPEYLAQRKDGTTFPVIARSTPLIQDEKVVGFRGILFDISKRKKIEEGQRILTDGLRKVVEITDELIACPDLDSLFRKAVELAREELDAERCSIFIEEDDCLRGTWGTDASGRSTLETHVRIDKNDRVYRKLLERSASGKNPRWTVVEGTYYECKESKISDFGKGWIAATLIQSSKGSVGVFFNDAALSGKEFEDTKQEILTVFCSLLGQVYERKRVEQERAHMEEQLRHSQKIDAIGRLAGGVAHDFNNLLTVILGNCTLLESSMGRTNEAHRYVRAISKAADHATSLTRQLLAFSRKQVLEPKRLNLNDIVAETEKMLRRLIGEDIELICISEPGLGIVRADPDQIQQIIMNLAVNSRDAMSAGGRLTVETANTDFSEKSARHHPGIKPGRYVTLRISDTGCGMDTETRERMFDPFFTTKKSGKGTGLGLSTVYGIVQQSSGHIEVESKTGHGTVFTIHLPRIKDAGTHESQSPSLSAAGGGTETILVVEDEQIVRDLVCGVLKDKEYTVLSASCAEEALKILEKHADSVDLLLTDVVMPNMSGRLLAEKVSTMAPRTRLLFMSGYSDDAIVHHGGMKEGVELLQKPFTPDALARKVREILDRP